MFWARKAAAGSSGGVRRFSVVQACLLSRFLSSKLQVVPIGKPRSGGLGRSRSRRLGCARRRIGSGRCAGRYRSPAIRAKLLVSKEREQHFTLLADQAQTFAVYPFYLFQDKRRHITMVLIDVSSTLVLALATVIPSKSSVTSLMDGSRSRRAINPVDRHASSSGFAKADIGAFSAPNTDIAKTRCMVRTRIFDLQGRLCRKAGNHLFTAPP